MGTIRTLLALCVAVFHSYTIGGLHFTGGRVAVQCFYIISGFYMALILNEKYIGEKYSYKSFISNRLLRIYPVYFVVLLLSFIVSLVALYGWDNPLYFGLYVPYWDKLSFLTKCWFVFENLALIGQEYLFFLKVNLSDGSLAFTQDAFMEKPQLILNGFTLVPQAWTLSIEITFYLLAPFIVRGKWYWQAGIVAASLGLRLFLFRQLDLTFDPWTYRFFPTELAFFVAGSLLFFLFKKVDNLRFAKQAGLVAFVFIIISIIFFDKVKMDKEEKCWYFYLIFSASLPFIFSLTKHSRVDRFIGELSYPIYLIHHLIMNLCRQYFWKHTQQMDWFGISVVAFSIPTALLLYFLVIRPVESIRLRKYSDFAVVKS